jgi:hypothetical protein
MAPGETKARPFPENGQTAVNTARDYAYVIGSEAQRAAISRVAGATFLPY